jgi:hypothetical protein
MYSFQFHDADGILEVRATGVWTTEMVESYRGDLAIAAEAARKRAGRLMMLFNATDYVVQPQDVATRAQHVERVVLPGDRIAVLISSSLLKLQARRVLAGWDRIELFVSEDSARAWLLAGGGEGHDAADIREPALSKTG